MNARLPWLWLYCIVNIVAALIMLNGSAIMGVVAYSQSTLLLATILTIVPYLIILGPVFNSISKIQVRKINFGSNEVNTVQKIGLILIFFQILYIFFNSANNINIAGTLNENNSVFSLFWVLFPIDTLFMIYYGLYREDKYIYPNMIIFIYSNVMRGWGGVIMFIIFIEWCRSFKKNKGSMLRTASVWILLGITVLICYPILLNFKWIIRYYAKTGLSVALIVDQLLNLLDFNDYMSAFFLGIEQIVERLQSVSMVVDVIQLSDLLQTKFINGSFVPFWMEGLHGIAFYKFFFSQNPVYIGVAFTGYRDFGFDFELGSWNVSLGYASWLFIAPYWTPIYVVYTFILGFFSLWLLKKIEFTELGKDFLWYIWLTYLLAPWLATFVAFIYALLVFILLKIVLSRIPTVLLLSKYRIM